MGGGTANFVVGLKDCLNEGGRMNPEYNIGGWNACERRTWCNEDFKNSFPSTLLPIFKQMKTISADGQGNNAIESDDYFALPAEKEVFGYTNNASATAEAELFQLEYFKTASNRAKRVPSGTTGYWEKSSRSDSVYYFCRVRSDGDIGSEQVQVTLGLAPICCI